MKTKKVPQHILQAVTGMLDPYIDGLNSQILLSSLNEYDNRIGQTKTVLMTYKEYAEYSRISYSTICRWSSNNDPRLTVDRSVGLPRIRVKLLLE